MTLVSWCRVVAILWLSALASLSVAAAESVRVAVAANFAGVAADLGREFEEISGYGVDIITGATGLLATQIAQGAPYDVFLAADTRRPQQLVEQAHAEASSLLIYAQGTLAFWRPEATEEVRLSQLSDAALAPVALANPALAPYGAAAEAVIVSLGVIDGPMRGSVQSGSARWVLAENVGGTFTLIASGNARAGFVALSQLLEKGVDSSEYYIIPSAMYPAINQQGLLTRRGADNAAARAFLAFLSAPRARSHIAAAGYVLPSNGD